MAERYEGYGATANGFGRHTLHKEARALRGGVHGPAEHARALKVAAERGRHPDPAGAARECVHAGDAPALLRRAHAGATRGPLLGPGERHELGRLLQAAAPLQAQPLRGERVIAREQQRVSNSSRPKKPKAEEPEWTPPEEYRAGQLHYATADDPEEF